MIRVDGLNKSFGKLKALDAVSVQCNAGVPAALPLSFSLDVSYVGQHSYERTGDGGSL